MTTRILIGDCLDLLRTMPSRSVQTCVTSPPYWGLRDYGVEGQLGLEENPEEYVRKIVAVFRQVRRVLRNDGTLWLNMGDSYTGGGRGDDTGSTLMGSRQCQRESRRAKVRDGGRPFDLGRKQLIGMPWRIAFALQSDGWLLRSDIVWHKPNPMPESVTDRPTKAHEYLFLFAKTERYFYHSRIRAKNNPSFGSAGEMCGAPWRVTYSEPILVDAAGSGNKERRFRQNSGGVRASRKHQAHAIPWMPSTREPIGAERTCRCSLASGTARSLVLDPFGGAGTTSLVAETLGRDSVLIELNESYAAMARERLGLDTEAAS